MARILTDILKHGHNAPHLGNILGAVEPMVRLSQEPGNEAFAFIADLHSLTTVKDAQQRTQNVHAVAATWLAFGFDTDKNAFLPPKRYSRGVRTHLVPQLLYAVSHVGQCTQFQGQVGQPVGRECRPLYLPGADGL